MFASVLVIAPWLQPRTRPRSRSTTFPELADLHASVASVRPDCLAHLLHHADIALLEIGLLVGLTFVAGARGLNRARPLSLGLQPPVLRGDRVGSRSAGVSRCLDGAISGR